MVEPSLSSHQAIQSAYIPILLVTHAKKRSLFLFVLFLLNTGKGDNQCCAQLYSEGEMVVGRNWIGRISVTYSSSTDIVRLLLDWPHLSYIQSKHWHSTFIIIRPEQLEPGASVYNLDWLACVNVRHPPSKNPVVVLSWICQQGKGNDRSEQIDWLSKQPLQAACVSEDLKWWGACDTICGHKAKDTTPSIAWRREA